MGNNWGPRGGVIDDFGLTREEQEAYRRTGTDDDRVAADGTIDLDAGEQDPVVHPTNNTPTNNTPTPTPTNTETEEVVPEEVVPQDPEDVMPGSDGTSSWQERAESESQAIYDEQARLAEQNTLKSRNQFESDRQEAVKNFFGSEMAANQKINNFGWTGGSLTDENLRTKFMQAGINAKLYSQEELIKAGFDSELAVARAHAELKEVELANHYYDKADMREIEAAKITGYRYTPEERDALNNYKAAQGILNDPDATDEDIERANGVMDYTKQWATSMFGETHNVDELMESFANFDEAMQEYRRTVEGQQWEDAKIRTAAMDAEADGTAPLDDSVRDEYLNGSIGLDAGNSVTINDLPSGMKTTMQEFIEAGATEASIQEKYDEIIAGQSFSDFQSMFEAGAYVLEGDARSFTDFSTSQLEEIEQAYSNDGYMAAWEKANGMEVIREPEPGQVEVEDNDDDAIGDQENRDAVMTKVAEWIDDMEGVDEDHLYSYLQRKKDSDIIEGDISQELRTYKHYVEGRSSYDEFMDVREGSWKLGTSDGFKFIEWVNSLNGFEEPTVTSSGASGNPFIAEWYPKQDGNDVVMRTGEGTLKRNSKYDWEAAYDLAKSFGYATEKKDSWFSVGDEPNRVTIKNMNDDNYKMFLVAFSEYTSGSITKLSDFKNDSRFDGLIKTTVSSTPKGGGQGPRGGGNLGGTVEHKV